MTIGNAIQPTGASRNTLKHHLGSLVERGHLKQQGAGREISETLSRKFNFQKLTG